MGIDIGTGNTPTNVSLVNLLDLNSVPSSVIGWAAVCSVHVLLGILEQNDKDCNQDRRKSIKHAEENLIHKLRKKNPQEVSSMLWENN